MATIRILIVDDHNIVRAGLRSFLETIEGIEIVGEASTGNSALALVEDLLPDLVLMDIQMPDGDGVEATRSIAANHPSVAVLVLTMYDDDDTVFAALRAGARGYLLKGADQDEVVQSIRSVAAGNITLGPGAAERVMSLFDAAPDRLLPFPGLSNRERDVLRLVASGQNNHAIGRELHLAPKTIANHVSNILTKLHFADRAEAIVQARRAGLAPDQQR